MNISTCLGVENSYCIKIVLLVNPNTLRLLLFAESYLRNVPPQLNYYNAHTLKINIIHFLIYLTICECCYTYILFRYTYDLA